MMPPSSTPAALTMPRFRWIATTLALSFASAAQAQFFKDPALEALYIADRFADLEKTGAARLAAKAEDAQAVLALAIAAMRGGNSTEDSNRRLKAIGHAETCVQRQPQAAACHYALGTVLGVQAMNEGMLKAAASVGRVKEALTQALALDGQWFPARSALTEFYLVAPGMMGGSTSKAKELAKGASNPEQARALEARVLIDAGKAEAALQALAQVKTAGDRALADDVAGWTVAAGISLINDGQAERARPAFERLYRERADDPGAAWGLARVQAEAGAHAEAIKLFSGMSKLQGAERFPIDYRIGISQQALGQKELARASFSKFVAAGKGSKKALEDAKARLEKLGA
jgi:hypothetical protein